MAEPRDDPNGFFLGREYEPPGLEWTFAPPSLRLKYWKRVGEIAADMKDRELAAGLDRHGRPLIPITQGTRARRLHPNYSPMGRADPNAPPLTPVYGASRTRSLLRHKAYPDGVAFHWAFDPHTGGSWGEVLDHHRKGPKVRDVIGLSPNSREVVKRRARAWWEATLRKIPAANRPETPIPVRYAPKPAKRAPVAPYTTDWHTIGADGSLVPITFTPRTFTPIVSVGVGR